MTNPRGARRTDRVPQDLDDADLLAAHRAGDPRCVRRSSPSGTTRRLWAIALRTLGHPRRRRRRRAGGARRGLPAGRNLPRRGGGAHLAAPDRGQRLHRPDPARAAAPDRTVAGARRAVPRRRPGRRAGHPDGRRRGAGACCRSSNGWPSCSSTCRAARWPRSRGDPGGAGGHGEEPLRTGPGPAGRAARAPAGRSADDERMPDPGDAVDIAAARRAGRRPARRRRRRRPGGAARRGRSPGGRGARRPGGHPGRARRRRDPPLPPEVAARWAAALAGRAAPRSQSHGRRGSPGAGRPRIVVAPGALRAPPRRPPLPCSAVRRLAVAVSLTARGPRPSWRSPCSAASTSSRSRPRPSAPLDVGDLADPARRRTACLRAVAARGRGPERRCSAAAGSSSTDSPACSSCSPPARAADCTSSSSTPAAVRPAERCSRRSSRRELDTPGRSPRSAAAGMPAAGIVFQGQRGTPASRRPQEDGRR